MSKSLTQISNPESTLCEQTTTLPTLAEKLLNLMNQQPNVIISSPNEVNETVRLDELNNQIQIIFASDIGLQFNDFKYVINTLPSNQNSSKDSQTQVNVGEKNKALHLNMGAFFSFSLLHKIGVLSDDLRHSKACAHIKPILHSLNLALVFAPLSVPNKKAPRRRASLHRANLQLNKKRNTTPTDNPPINCLNQCNHDIQQWEQDLLAHFMKACGELLLFAPADFNRAIERLVTIHHHWHLLLQNHLKRLHVWLFNQLQLKHATLANEGINNELVTTCLEQLSENAQTFTAQLNSHQHTNENHLAHEHQYNPEQDKTNNQASYDNYLISRHQIQLLLAQLTMAELTTHQSKSINTVSPLLTNRVFVLFEPNHKLADKLCHMLGLHQKLIDLFWYDVCHLSESICQLETEQFNQQTLQCFYQAQNFRNHLRNISVSIENLANQLHFSTNEVLNALSRIQYNVLDLVHYQTPNFTENTATIGKVTIHHSEQGQFAQLTQVEYAASLVELLQTFDDIVAAISYQHCKPLDHMQLSQVQKLAKINLDTLNQSMDNAYGNWLQLLNLLRSNDVKQNRHARQNNNDKQTTESNSLK